MKRAFALIFIVALAAAAGSCQFKLPEAKPDPQPTPQIVQAEWIPSAPAGKHTFAIFHYRGFGHGCAVNGVTLTNRHIVDPRLPETFFIPIGPLSFRFGFANGPQGTGRSIMLSASADVAQVKLSSEPANYATLAVHGPAVGETIMWVEYDFRTQGEAFERRYRTTTINRIVAGHAILEDTPVGGASGGCAYNAAGEVLGLMTFGMPTSDLGMAGGITALWGEWWKDAVR
jgi:hypothetical protein